MSLAENLFLKPKWMLKVWTRKSFILQNEIDTGKFINIINSDQLSPQFVNLRHMKKNLILTFATNPVLLCQSKNHIFKNSILDHLHTKIFELNWTVFSDKTFVFKTIYPNLFADSSIISRRFSFKDVSMELNFCFTCFKGKLRTDGKKLIDRYARRNKYFAFFS